MIQFKENARRDGRTEDGRTHGRTGGQTLFHRTLPTTAGGPIKINFSIYFNFYINIVAVCKLYAFNPINIHFILLVHVFLRSFCCIKHIYGPLGFLNASFMSLYSANTSFNKANSLWLIFESIKALEIKISILRSDTTSQITPFCAIMEVS